MKGGWNMEHFAVTGLHVGELVRADEAGVDGAGPDVAHDLDLVVDEAQLRARWRAPCVRWCGDACMLCSEWRASKERQGAHESAGRVDGVRACIGSCMRETPLSAKTFHWCWTRRMLVPATTLSLRSRTWLMCSLSALGRGWMRNEDGWGRQKEI